MSKLARVLALGALLAATTLASTTAVAYADEAAVTQDGRRPPTEHQVGEPDHRRVAPQQATADATRRAALAQEHYYSTWGYSQIAGRQPLEARHVQIHRSQRICIHHDRLTPSAANGYLDHRPCR